MNLLQLLCSVYLKCLEVLRERRLPPLKLGKILYSAPVENEVTLHKRNFDAYQAICCYPGTFERVRQSLINASMHVLI
jgi:hypothetical protein